MLGLKDDGGGRKEVDWRGGVQQGYAGGSCLGSILFLGHRSIMVFWRWLTGVEESGRADGCYLAFPWGSYTPARWVLYLSCFVCINKL
jgi:hypothetical protein